MNTDLCALTDEVLPLYTEGALAPQIRMRIDEHAAGCPSCRERLERAAATLAPPPGAKERTDRPGWQMPTRLKRALLYALIVIMIGAGGLGFALTRKRPDQLMRLPATVKNAEQLAVQAIPGWNRAKAAGLVVNIGITEKIAGTNATVTIEKAWYSGREAYILYTVKAPKGGHVLATEALLGGSGAPTRYGQTDWPHLNQWGGFSSEGFHGVLIFPQLKVPPATERLSLNLRRWAPVTAEAGLDRTRGSTGAGVTVPLPWQSAYMNERVPDVVQWSRQQTWMGRTLIVADLWVGIGRTALTGRIELPAGEFSPRLNARLLVAGKALAVKDFEAQRIGAGNSYTFTATFDGLDQWPAPVKLELSGITFVTDQRLEWPINWGKYRDMPRDGHRLLPPAEQIPVRFYDSQLIGIVINSGGIAIEQRDPTGPPPYVRANIGYSGPTLTIGGPGMELRNAQDEVVTNLGSGAGAIYDDAKGHDQRQGIAVFWEDTLPDSFRQSDRLVLRYVHPAATMVLKDTWTAPAPHSAARVDGPAHPAGDGPVPCRPNVAPTRDEMLSLLTRVSMYAPLDHLTGPALALEQQWLAMEPAGWPEEAGTWVGDAWFALDVAQGADETYVVHLQHGEALRYDDRFMVVCNDSRWQVKQYARGADADWMQPAHELVGQRDELTLALAVELVKVARSSSGPWFAQVTTGNSLAWGRVSAVYRARGWPGPYDAWRRVAEAEGVMITQIDPMHAELGYQGYPPLLRFAKPDGLWKIDDATEGGTWVRPAPDVRLSEPGRVFDPPFGMLLGITDEQKIEERFGPPDAVTTSDTGKAYAYHIRRLEVGFDAQGKVVTFAMKTGAPRSGVRIGSPVALWTLVYGPQGYSANSGDQPVPQVTVQDGRIAEIKLIRP